MRCTDTRFTGTTCDTMLNPHTELCPKRDLHTGGLIDTMHVEQPAALRGLVPNRALPDRKRRYDWSGTRLVFGTDTAPMDGYKKKVGPAFSTTLIGVGGSNAVIGTVEPVEVDHMAARTAKHHREVLSSPATTTVRTEADGDRPFSEIRKQADRG